MFTGGCGLSLMNSVSNHEWSLGGSSIEGAGDGAGFVVAGLVSSAIPIIVDPESDRMGHPNPRGRKSSPAWKGGSSEPPMGVPHRDASLQEPASDVLGVHAEPDSDPGK